MKTTNIYILFILIVSCFSTGCADWLDVDPIGENLEEDQYSTERNINSVLNGFYIDLTKKSLYGNNLSKTTIEQLAHYYYAPEHTGSASNYSAFINLQKYNYTEQTVENTFSSIWSNLYSIIFNINHFIANTERAEAVSTEKRDLLLGEAYALRAFLHLDIFRLFGPIYEKRTTAEVLPYNTTTKADNKPLPYLNAEEYMGKVLSDINTATILLEKDPILKYGIMNPQDTTGLASQDVFNRFARNKRMNIVAVKILEARCLAVMGELNNAAEVALDIINTQNILEDINGTNRDAIFTWIKGEDILNEKARDYIFSKEVVFSIDYLDLSESWEQITETAVQGQTYTIHGVNLLENIFKLPENTQNLKDVSDLRIKQWSVADAISSEEYVSMRYKKFAREGKHIYINNMQPLMRITELYYLVLENYINNGNLTEATNLANSIKVRRGYKANELYPYVQTAEELNNFLTIEYYREFYSEGQAFYFLKRRASNNILASDGSLGFQEMDIDNYVVPIPSKEVNE